MAGAGYKLFNSGDVLTAAQVNTYLQEQAVMRFANASARTTALSGVLAEGMMSYLDDTNAVEVYNGSAWVSISADQTPLTTKGDLFTYSTTDARLGVGSNGETLVADSSTTTGLRWAADWNTGKNKIINGDFFINQRGFTSITSGYGFDRWEVSSQAGNATFSAQTFTTGAAPVAGYEARNFARLVTTTQNNANDYGLLWQKIEDVRTFANQTITYSFWAKAGSGTPKVAIGFSQNFGSGGSPSAAVYTYAGQATLSTSWARYSVTVAIPSISGKTIGTTANTSFLRADIWASAGSDYNANTGSLGLQNITVEIWGVQAEAGSVATPFTTATGTLAGELVACERYYYKFPEISNYQYGAGFCYSTTQALIPMKVPTTMRATPTITLSAGNTFQIYNATGTQLATTAVASTEISVWGFRLTATVASGLVAGDGTSLHRNSSSVEVSAEL